MLSIQSGRKVQIYAKIPLGREPRSSGYGRRLMFWRSWVRIPVLCTIWTFFTLICCENCIVCLKRPKINKKEAVVGSIKKNFVRELGRLWWTVERWESKAIKNVFFCHHVISNFSEKRYFTLDVFLSYILLKTNIFTFF